MVLLSPAAWADGPAASRPEFKALDFTPKTTASGATVDVVEVGLAMPKGVQDCYSFVDMDRTLLLWVRMDNAGGNTATDLSTCAQTGTVDGDVVKDDGKFGKTATFTRDGKAGQITFDANSLHTLGDAATISFWVKSPDYGLAPDYHQNKGPDGKLLNYCTSQPMIIGPVNITSFGATRGRCLKLFSIWPHCNGTQTGVWGEDYSHVAYVLDPAGDGGPWRRDCDGCVRLCVNGRWIPIVSEGGFMANLLARTKISPRPTPLKIGGAFDGSLSDIVVFKRVLSERELRSLYLASKLFDSGDVKDFPYNNGFTNLTPGEHTFRGYLADTKGNVYRTEERTVTVRNR